MKSDVIIIGAGPSGTVAAAFLLKAGYSVSILEKSVFPRPVIGESLLPRVMQDLEDADLLDAIEAEDFQYKKGALFYNNSEKKYQFDFAHKSADYGYSWTYQVPRDRFDHCLANEVARKGAQIHYNTGVVDVSIKKQEVTVTTDQNSIFQAKYIIDASGYGRVLPRLFQLDKASNFPSRAAVFAQVKDPSFQQRDRDVIDIIDIGETDWAWVIPFKNGISSLGFIVTSEEAEKQNDLEAYYRSLIQKNSYLNGQFDVNGELLFTPKLIKGYSIGVTKTYGERFVLTGNATEFLDPIFSSGVTFAVVSARRAAEQIIKELKGEPVDWEEDYEKYIAKGVDVFRTFVETWYNGDLKEVIYATKADPAIKSHICSILAGYVWDQKNPIVRRHSRAIKNLAEVIRKDLINY